MKKGLTQTLLTVAIALLGYQALAMAPVISEIPSPVIGNQDVTASSVYVWPDAIALDNFVTDTGTATDQIKWYYRVERDGTPNAQHYMLNGVASLDETEAAATDGATLPEAKRIDNQVLQSELNPDTSARTVTIRNIFLSPLGGGAGGTVTGDDSEVITLFASDGAAFSTKGVMFYTQVNGTDHIYNPAPAPFVTNTFATTEGWTYTGYTTGVTSARSTNTALCFDVSQDGNSYAVWISPMGLFTVEQNSVYKIRANLNSTYTTAGHTPFWDMYVNNYNGTDGLNLFGADLLILNTPQNNSNAVVSSTNGTDFQLWFAPICVGTAQWDANYAAAATGNNMKVFVGFRTLDVKKAELGTAVTNGQTCLNELDITRYPVASATPSGSNVYSRNSDFVQTTASVSGNTLFDTILGTGISITGGVVTLTPSTASASVDICTLSPGTDTLFNLGTNDIGDNYPITWESDTLYRATYTLAAPSAGAEANPFDAIYIGFDTPSNECLYETYVTNFGTNKLAMPKATAATYQAFWWSHKVSNSTAPYYNHFRTRLTVLNNTSLTVGTNAGGVKVSAIAVSKVTF